MSRNRFILTVAAVVLLGFILKYLPVSQFGTWPRSYGAAIFYEVFWILLLGTFARGWSAPACAIVVFAATGALEFLQRVHGPMLDGIRGTWLGRALIGSSFDPWDFAAYAAGCAFGAVLLRRLRNPAR